jgi:hypothetical protein
MHDSGVIGRGHSDFSHTPADTTSRFNTLPVESGSGAHSGDDIGLQVQIVQGPGAEGRPPGAPRLQVAGRHQKTGTLTTLNVACGFCAIAQAGTCRRDTPGMSRWHNAACALAPDGENVDAIEGVPAA